MRSLAECSVDSVVTDPPYDLTSRRPGGRSEATRGAVMGGFMGMKWDGSGVAFDPETWIEALRVLKPGGHLLAFGGTRTHHRLMCAIEDAGFELRDTIMWVYGSGFPKSKNLGGKWAGWGTALKPAWEPIIVARKPLIGTVAENVLAHGTGAINVDACRIKGAAGNGVWGSSNKTVDPDRTFVGSPHASEFRTERNEAGRWPANLIHDGSDEVLACFPQNEDRFFYCAKASRQDRNDGCEDLPEKTGGMVSNTSGQHITRRDGGAPGPRANHHPTVKPTDLMRYLCRLVTPPSGIVLDPFMGSGSTLKAAELEGFDAIGIDIDAQYVAIASARIAADAPLFADLQV